MHAMMQIGAGYLSFLHQSYKAVIVEISVKYKPVRLDNIAETALRWRRAMLDTKKPRRP